MTNKDDARGKRSKYIAEPRQDQEGSTNREDVHKKHSESSEEPWLDQEGSVPPTARRGTTNKRNIARAVKSRCRIKQVRLTARRGAKGIESAVKSRCRIRQVWPSKT